jgi:GNAT superfamily N-acetyltransferase
MGSFRIRDGRRADTASIGAMWQALMAHHRALDPRFTIAPDAEQKYVRHVQEMIRSRNARALVAEDPDAGVLIGYLLGEIQSRPPLAQPGLYGFISDIYVQEAWRQRGVGRALFEEMRRWFVDRKANAIELYIAEANPTAAVFWKEMGLSPFLKLLHLDL